VTAVREGFFRQDAICIALFIPSHKSLAYLADFPAYAYSQIPQQERPPMKTLWAIGLSGVLLTALAQTADACGRGGDCGGVAAVVRRLVPRRPVRCRSPTWIRWSLAIDPSWLRPK